jgi:hypothetical protein
MFLRNRRSVSELVLMTLGLVFILIVIFGLIHSGGFSLSALLSDPSVLFNLFTDPKDISQSESAYIDAIGSIAIGFAGAWVAIKIALVATNLQEQDSLNKVKEMYQKDADRISMLNLNLTRSVLDAKRSCTSFIVLLRSNPKIMMSESKKNIYNNDLVSVDIETGEKLLVDFYARLESDVSKLIDSIEELVMDNTYIMILRKSWKNSTYDKLSSFFEQTHEERTDIIDRYKKIILQDDERYNFYQEYIDNQNNFGEGLHYLRAHLLISKRKEYLMNLLQKTNDRQLTPSQSAWLLLGSLILGEKDNKNEDLTYNTGFLFLSLMLGSQIDNDLLKVHLTSNGVEEPLAHEVSQTIFFVHGKDEKSSVDIASMLTELSDLLTPNGLDLHSMLLIPGENKANSLNSGKIVGNEGKL